MDDDRTIIPPSLQKHRRQQKIAWCQHIKQTLRRLCESDNLFLKNSITHTKDKCTAITKNDTNNAKHVAINSAHAQRNQPTIRLAQCGRNNNKAYRLGSTFKKTIKKLNRTKHVSFVKQNKVHLFDATTTPSIMLTYNSGANGHYISEQDQHKAGLPDLWPSTQWVGVANTGTICHPIPLSITLCAIKANRCIPGLSHISNGQGQDIRWRHRFSLHKGGHQGIQGIRHPHSMQRRIHSYWHPR